MLYSIGLYSTRDNLHFVETFDEEDGYDVWDHVAALQRQGFKVDGVDAIESDTEGDDPFASLPWGEQQSQVDWLESRFDSMSEFDSVEMEDSYDW